MVNFSLEGKTALVTGASYGIGFAIATAFAEAGATIVFNDIRQELVDKGLAAYREKGIQAHGYVCDVTDEEAVKAFIARVEQEVGTIDILVNNAGIIKRIPMCEMSAAEFRQVIDVDLNAPFIVSKAVIPGMIRKGHGKIINICSMMSELGRETVSAYAAAKGGLKMLTRNIARNTANTTSSVTASGRATSPLPRPHHSVNVRPTDRAILRCIHRGQDSGLPLGNSGRSDGTGRVPGFRSIRLRQRTRAVCRRRYSGLYRKTTQITPVPMNMHISLPSVIRRKAYRQGFWLCWRPDASRIPEHRSR